MSFFYFTKRNTLCACVYIYTYIYMIYLYNPISFIHSSVGEHLGCFHILSIVNNAAMNIVVHVSFQIGVFAFFRYILRSGITGSYGSSIFSFFFLGTSIQFFIVAAQIYTSTSSVEGFLLLHILANIRCL